MVEELESQVFNLKLANQDYEDRLAKLYQTEDRSKWKGPAVLLNDLEAADRDVERLEDTVADLQDQLERATRGGGNGTGINGNGGGGDMGDEAVRAGSSATERNGGDSGCSGGTHHRDWEARIAGIQERIAGLEEDNRVLTEAAGWEARDVSEEEHELLTPAAKSQRRRAIDMLSERIRQLTELFKSSLGREDAARVAAEKISVDLDEAVARIEELEAALLRYRDLAVLAEERADAAQRKTEEERRTMDAGRVAADGAEPESERNTEEEGRTMTDTRGVNTDAWALEAPEGLPADACERLERLEVDARRWRDAYVSVNDQLEDEKRLSNETDRRLVETEDSVRELTARLRERDREGSADRSSSAEFEERHGQLSREVADEEKNDGARGDDNETSGQAGASFEERSSVGGKSPAESASTEDDAAWNRVRSSAETQRNDNGWRQEQWQQELQRQQEDDGEDADLSLSVLLDRDPGPESSTVTSNAIPIGGEEDGAAAAGTLPVSARATVTITISPVPEPELELESDAPMLTPEGASGGLGGEGDYGAQRHYEEQELSHTSNSPSDGFQEVRQQADVSRGKFERLLEGESSEDAHAWRSATADGDQPPTVDSLPQATGGRGEEVCVPNISENDTEQRRMRMTGADGVGDLQQQQQQQQDVQKGMVTFSRASTAGDRAPLADGGKKSNTPASSEPSEIREGRRNGEGGDAKRPMSSGATTIVDGFPAGDERGMAVQRVENAARRAEAAANRANSSAENARSDRLAAETAASAADVAAARAAKAAMTMAMTAPLHGSFDGASALQRRPSSAPQPNAVAARVTVSNSAMMPTERSIGSADPMRASLESSRASIDGEDRGATARLVSRASLVAKLDKLAADAAATKAMASPASSQARASLGAAATPKRAIVQSPERSRVVGRSNRLDRSGSIDQVERVIAAVATRTSGSRGSSRVAEDYWQRPVAEAAASVSTTSQRPRRSPEITPMPTTSTTSPTFFSSGRERADKRGHGAIAVDERESRASWSPASGAFVGPYGPDGTRSTVQQAAQVPTPAGASRAVPGRSGVGRSQAGRLTKSWLDDNSSRDVHGRLADAFCDGGDVRDTRGRPPRATRCVPASATLHRANSDGKELGGEPMAPSGRPKKKVKKKIRASKEVAAAPARREHHHAHAHRGPCARSCACSTCPCSDAPPSTSSTWHLRRRSLSISRR